MTVTNHREQGTAESDTEPAPMRPARHRIWRVMWWGTAIVVAISVTISAIASLYYYRATRGGLPQTSGRIAIEGLTGDVDVLRDRWGVPHILASSAHDVYFTQG